MANEDHRPSSLPTVSVVLPAYNGSRTILRTLQSLQGQTYAPLQWIIIDDASSDNTVQLIQDFVDFYRPPVILIRHKANQGLSRTLNDGLRRATADFVLIIHQDIELAGSDWIARAVSKLSKDDRLAVVTCYYGATATDDLTFVKRSFGFLRRQFHQPPGYGEEFVTFTEFKCDLVRRSVFGEFGGFPTRFRISGEDIMLSYLLRRSGWKILKVYGLVAVQRFTGPAETLLGNLHKEFRFGESIAGVLLAFRSYPFRDLRRSAYARTRSFHRASQPAFAVAVISLAILSAFLGTTLALSAVGALVVARYAYYVRRLWPEFNHFLGGQPRARSESLAAGFLGLLSDFVYPLGIATGMVRSAYGAPL